MNYLRDEYICQYDGTMVNLSNFDTCLFYSIPNKRKMICLNGFDKNNIDINDNSSKSNTDKNKIQSILVNKIINNLKTKKNYKNINIFYYSSKKPKKVSKKILKKILKKISDKDIFIKNNKQQKQNLNPKNIQFTIGSNIQININF